MPAPPRKPRPAATEPRTLAALRARLGLTQIETARLLRCDPRTYQRWEQGSPAIPAVLWALLCERAGVPETWEPPTVPEPARTP